MSKNMWLHLTVVVGLTAGTANVSAAEWETSPTAAAELEPFGYDIFSGQVQEVTEGPVDEDYLVGPRDELLIETWGEYSQRYPVQVSEDGYIDLEPEDLRLFVNGQTLREVREKVKMAMRENHAAYFDPENPKAWVSVIPMRVRNILVYVAGEVVRPGTFSISSTVASLINVLTNAGGVKPRGSLRNVRISRADGQAEEYDLYDFLIRGNTDPVQARLRYGETVFVSLKRKSVTVSGCVRRQGVYELIEGESLSDVIEFAGGPAPGAYLERIQIERRALNKGTRRIDVNYAELQDAGTTFPLLDGDVIHIYPAVEEDYVVYLDGEGVYRPGVYQFTEGMTLVDLIEKGEGLRGEAYLEKADLYRTRIDFTKEYSSFSLARLYRKNSATGKVDLVGDKSDPANFPLQRLDVIVVYSYYEIIGGDKTVTLDGHVKQPGEYLLAENMHLADLLFAYGGFEDPDWRKATYLKRAELWRTNPDDLTETLITFDLGEVLAGDPKADLELQSLDRILVYSYDEVKKKEKYVRLEGHVKEPGEHLLSVNMRLSDLFFAYGGFEDKDWLKATYLDRADLYRTNPDNLSVRVIPIDLRQVLAGDPAADLVLQSLDRVVVYEYKDFHPDSYFTISGAVRRPGHYLLAENATLSDAIVMARGLLDEAYKYEAEIVRTSPAAIADGQPAEVLHVPITGVFATEPHEKGFRLMKDDAIFVRTLPGWEKPRSVMVTGEVGFPGEYVLAKAEERLSDLIRRAGGLRDTAYTPGAVFLRSLEAEATEARRVAIDLARALARPGGERDLILRDGDVLRVPTDPMTVEVRGAVYAPATVQYRAGKGVDYYVGLCGGYRDDAQRRQALILNPDGTTARRGWGVFGPEPLSGSLITVPPYEPVEEAMEPVEARRESWGWPQGNWTPPPPVPAMTSPTVRPVWEPASPGESALESPSFSGGEASPSSDVLGLLPGEETTTRTEAKAYPSLSLPIP